MTINEFHSKRVKHIKYTETTTPMSTVADFYNEFLVKGNRLPVPAAVKEWHNLLVKYVNDSSAKTFIARKYSSEKEDDVWNNRRGAVVQFSDGFEVVYADNFLAQEIYLMAWHGFYPPSYKDFKDTIENRELHITSGTAVEKLIRLYPSSSKLCGGYLAHVVDVNGKYLREDGSYKEISSAEGARIYPLGTASDWITSPDKIYHVPYTLSDEEKGLAKAHFLRFLDPLNHFVTPLTKHCKHTLPSWPCKKNIGEYDCLTYFIQEQRVTEFSTEYVDFSNLGKFKRSAPAGYTGSNVIDLEIVFSKKTGATAGSPSSVATPTVKVKKKPSSKGGKKTRTKYILEGIEYSYQRHLLLGLVKQYCKDNKHATYNDLMRVFNLKLSFNQQNVIRLPGELSADDIAKKRVFLSDSIKLYDGTIVLVNNQVQAIDMPEIIRIATSLGYTIA